tara:strand:+ start:840 stop:1055 length:216 start_codon:yes stop_codon:yes gene_type:complete
MDKDKIVTYNQKDVFVKDPDNPNNLIMKIPDDILKKKGWSEGTKIKISVGDQGTIIIQEAEQDEDKSQQTD